MKKIKALLNTVILTATSAAMTAAYATADPFKTATDKTNQLTNYMSGGFALALTAIVITIAGLGMIFHKVKYETGVKIIGGAIVVGSATSLAAFLLG